jgi:hypothetical protein
MKTYDEIMAQVLKGHALGDDYELREVARWTVHCAHCGVQLIGDTPQTDKAFEHLKRAVQDRTCRNPNCVSRGGTEQRRRYCNRCGYPHSSDAVCGRNPS